MTAYEKFKKMVAEYKAMGVRMVAIDYPYDWSILMAFNTHGKSADEIDKRRFLSPAVRDWATGFNDFGPDDVVQVLDVTDDFGEMSFYDNDCKFVVQQLA